jgi:hypothetical protein
VRALAAVAALLTLGFVVSLPLDPTAVVIVGSAKAIPFVSARSIVEAKAANELVTEQINISRLANEEQHIIAFATEFPFKQRLMQPFVEVEGKFGRETVSRNNLRAQSACMQRKQVIHWRRHSQGENWACVIVHQNSWGPPDILKFEPHGLAKLNIANETVQSCLDLVSDNNRMQKWSLHSDQTVFRSLRGTFGGVCGPMSAVGGTPSDGQRLFHVGRLLVGNGAQGSSFRIEAARFRGQEGRKYDEGKSEDDGANCGQRIDGVPIGSGPIGNKNTDAGPILIYGTLVILTFTLGVIFVTMRDIKKQKTHGHKTDQDG